MKKLLSICVLVFISSFLWFNSSFLKNSATYCFDDSMSREEIEKEITDKVQSQIEGLDFSKLEEILNSMTDEELRLFGNSSFVDKISSLLKGENVNSANSIWQGIVNLLLDNILKISPMIFLIIAVGVIFSIFSASRFNEKNKSLTEVIHFICFGAICIIVMSLVSYFIGLTKDTIYSIKSQTDVLMPILLTIMTTIGSTMSVSVYQPIVVLLSSGMITIFTKVLLPIFVFSLVFAIVSNISNNVKLNKFSSFFSSLFKWIIGFTFTVFSGVLTIQGITAGSFDGISIKTAKYAIKNSIPIIGSYISDGFNLIVASSVLIKNSIGAGGLILLFSTIVIPILKLIIFMLSLKFVSAVLEPICDAKMSNFVGIVAKSISLLIILILGCAFSYLLLTGLIMCTSNVF